MNCYCWIWAALCFLIGSSASGPSPVEVSAVLGEEVTFRVQIKDGFETDKIICIFKGALIAEMKFGFNYTVMDERFEGRLRAADESGSIKIRNPSTEDSGEYTIEIYNRKKPTLKETKRYELKIFSRVTTHISPMMNSDSANGTCQITFNCTVNNNTKVNYSWSGEMVGPSVGPILSLNLTENASNQSVCCTVKNPVSKASACIRPREHCFPDPGNTSGNKSSKPGYIVELIVSAFAVVCAVIIGILLYKRVSAKGRKDKAAISTVYAQVNLSNNKSKGGNPYTSTEAEHSKPKINTIYADVQKTPQMGEPMLANGYNSASEKDTATTLYETLPEFQRNNGEASDSPHDRGCDSGSPFDEII